MSGLETVDYFLSLHRRKAAVSPMREFDVLAMPAHGTIIAAAA
ncbi:MAG: hypothetical protein ACI9C3_002237 [Yoonia sp.]|jgi:hypothetical protein